MKFRNVDFFFHVPLINVMHILQIQTVKKNTSIKELSKFRYHVVKGKSVLYIRVI